MSRVGGGEGRPREQVQRNEKTQVARVAARVLQLETVHQSSLENDLQRVRGVQRMPGQQLDCFKLSAVAEHILSFNCLFRNANQIE